MDMTIIIGIIVALGVGAALYFFVFKKKSSTQAATVVVPATSAASPWAVLNSSNMPSVLPADSSGKFYFDFPLAPGSVHAILRKAVESGRSSITFRFRIDGNAGWVATEGASAAGVRLMLQRRGDNYSGAGEYEHYRFWSAKAQLANGELQMIVPLTYDLWTSVYGRTDAAAFAALLADLEHVGFSFGGDFAAHGVYAQGNSRFTIVEYTVS